MPGRAAAQMVPIQTRAAPTLPVKCCDSSLTSFRTHYARNDAGRAFAATGILATDPLCGLNSEQSLSLINWLHSLFWVSNFPDPKLREFD